MKISEIAKLLSLDVKGNVDIDIKKTASIMDASSDEITFVRNSKFLKHLNDKTDGAVILKPEDDSNDFRFTRLLSEDPEISFIECLKILHPTDEFVPNISKLSSVADDTEIDDYVIIEDFVVVKSGSKVGKGTKISSNCVIGKNVTIGEDVLLYPGVVIYDDCIIGDRSIIHSNSVVGSDGFGYTIRKGKQIKIPQVGNVIIGCDVEIGAGVTIDRAALDSTIIGNGTKIDNLCQIAHNCEVGENCAFSAQLGMAGHTKVEDDCLFGGQVGLGGHLTIGKGSMIYAKTGVSSDVKPGSTIFGIPGLDFKEKRKEMMAIRRLSRFYQRVKDIEEKLKEN